MLSGVAIKGYQPSTVRDDGEIARHAESFYVVGLGHPLPTASPIQLEAVDTA